ncbi:MAG TPA: HAD family hydrolase [Candidatus Polarisedimenticolia bacterium]|jgi:2-haloalkanoic acid dehalogenase type II|nr:HAD family hydrolase [Candidatus Polarisedimenticolia bacterium]
MPESRPFEIVTFDCYGTLIDWETGISEAFLGAAAQDGVRLDPRAVLEAYAAIEPEFEAGRFRSYREVLTETARRVAERLGWSMPPERAGFLPESLPAWPPFSDTNPAFERLARGGLALGILSNVDDDLLERTCRHLRAEFDLKITAQQVRSYKPGHAHFLEARRRIGGRRWLHAAQSHFHDVVPALALGIPVVWVNRKATPLPAGAPAPLAIVPHLSALADFLER